MGLPGGGEAAVVRVHYFTSGARRAVQQALLEGEIDGVDGYVVDLRNNPGACPCPTLRCPRQLAGAAQSITSCSLVANVLT